MLNRGDVPIEWSMKFGMMQLEYDDFVACGAELTLRDLWLHDDVASNIDISGAAGDIIYTTTVQPHETVVLRVKC